MGKLKEKYLNNTEYEEGMESYESEGGEDMTLQIGNEVIITAKGRIKCISEEYDGCIKYEVLQVVDNKARAHCFVYECNIIKEDDRAFTYGNIAKG